MEDKKKLIMIVGAVFLGLVYFLGQSNMNFSKLFNPSEDDTNFSLNYGDKIIKVHVSGEVMLPNVYVVKEGTILEDLLDLAGRKPTSDLRDLNLADIVIANAHYKITSIYDDEISIAEPPTNPGENNNQTGLVNINTATLAQLMTLNGIGSVTAQNIINYRKTNIFYSINDLKNVNGIGDTTFDRIKNYITV